jgi:thioredoxin-like negative regulator of GroEL
MRERYRSAPTFGEYLETVRQNAQLWRGLYDRVSLPEELVQEARTLPAPVYLLALSEDWCGDAVNLLPVVARLAEAVPGWELRVLGRDENPDLMDSHLTDGRSRSIPVVMVLDDRYREVGWWGPRPEELQSWVLEHLFLPSGERYQAVRRWYARDGGRTTVRELLDLVTAALSVR